MVTSHRLPAAASASQSIPSLGDVGEVGEFFALNPTHARACAYEYFNRNISPKSPMSPIGSKQQSVGLVAAGHLALQWRSTNGPAIAKPSRLSALRWLSLATVSTTTRTIAKPNFTLAPCREGKRERASDVQGYDK